MESSDRTTTVPVTLASGAVINFQISQPAGRQNVASKKTPNEGFKFEQVTKVLQEIVGNLKETLDKVKPDKASVKFGVELATETGGLTALIVKGSGKGNLEITLEWVK